MKPLFAIAAVLLVSAGAAGASVPDDIRHVLMRDGFSRNLIERHEGRRYRVNIANVGTIRTRSKTYRIMFYSNEDQRPAGHGNYALLVFIEHPGRFRYIGGYSVRATPLRMRSTTIHFDSRCDWGCTITFDENGPPARAWIDGENPTLAK